MQEFSVHLMFWQDIWHPGSEVLLIIKPRESWKHSQVATACPWCATTLWTWSFEYHGSHFQAHSGGICRWISSQEEVDLRNDTRFLAIWVGWKRIKFTWRCFLGSWVWVFRATRHGDLALKLERIHAATMIHEINLQIFAKPGLI